MQWGPLEGKDDIRPDREWMDLEHQPGFAQRAKMVTDLVELVRAIRSGATTVCDLGCGDGALLRWLKLGKNAWGYELGRGDVEYGRSRGTDVIHADIVEDWAGLTYGDVIIASEVLEHITDPVTFLSRLPRDPVLIVSSPSRESGVWHNPIHTWAWDLAGYRDVVERGGWVPVYQVECDGGENTFNGITGKQCFQAIVAVR